MLTSRAEEVEYGIEVSWTATALCLYASYPAKECVIREEFASESLYANHFEARKCRATFEAVTRILPGDRRLFDMVLRESAALAACTNSRRRQNHSSFS